MKKLFFGLIILSFFIIISPVFAATQITNNDFDDFLGTASGKWATYEGWDGNDEEIFLYDRETNQSLQITNNNYTDAGPKITGGYVVYLSTLGEQDSEIVLYNIITKTTKIITNNSYTDFFFDFNENFIVWRANNTFTWNVFLYDITTQQTRQLTNYGFSVDNPTAIEDGPFVSDNQIIWIASWNSPGQFSIFKFDFLNNSFSEFLRKSGQKMNPSLSYPYLAWQQFDGNDTEIMLFNFDTNNLSQLTNNNYYDVVPKTFKGKVVWEGHIISVTHIFFYDGSLVKQLTNSNSPNTDPFINSNGIIWIGYDGDREIFFSFDGNSTIKITNNNRANDSPVLATNMIFVREYDGNDWEIIAYNIPMINPTDGGTLKCGFGCKPNHQGIDIDKTLYQKPVKVPASGTIVKIDNIDDSNAGKWVWINHGDITKLDGTVSNKIATRYLHLDTIDSSLNVGQQIAQGITIGTVGGTGGNMPYTPHLHFEVRQGDIPLDLDYRKTTALDPLGFVSYSSSILSVTAFSPVDISVTDPEGMVIDKTRNDFGSAADYFAPQYKGIPDDGEDIDGYDMITFDQKKDGDYLVRVIPEQGALPEDTFTLKVNICGISTTLSENTLISNIPDSSYLLRLTECSFERFIPTKIIIPVLNTEYVLGSQIQIQFSAVDNIFGTASISAKLNGIGVFNGQNVILIKPGDNTLEIIAIDNNGYATILTKTFSVIYNFGGFLTPIKIDGSGIYNLGRTLPVKFQLSDVNGNFVSIASAQLYVAKISDGIIGNDEIPLSTSSADTGNQFRYDFSNNQYIYNLSTDTFSVGTWQLKAILDSEQVHTATISIR